MYILRSSSLRPVRNNTPRRLKNSWAATEERFEWNSDPETICLDADTIRTIKPLLPPYLHEFDGCMAVSPIDGTWELT